MICYTFRTHIFDFINDADLRIMVSASEEARMSVLTSLTTHSTYGMVAVEISS
jgi:hypothetical protein